MFTELAIVGLTTYSYRKIKYNKFHKEETKLREKWNLIMQNAGIKNKDEIFSSYKLHQVVSTDYGFDCEIIIPNGLDFDKLTNLKPLLETNLNCICEIEKDNFNPYANLKIITNPLNNLTYQPIKTKPYELFLGYKYDGEPYKINMAEDSHLLIAGIRGSGKSRLQFIALTTLLHNHKENEVEIYLMELLKKDLKKFKNMNQVKIFTDTLIDSKIVLEKIEKMLEKRADKIDSMGVENIVEYNNIAKIKMKYIYIFADEFSLFMPEESDSEQEKEQKDKILSVIKKISKLGRSVGIWFISGLQRSTITEINSLVKSQMCRCSFSQLSARDSENIIGINDAYGLRQQECIIFTGHEYVRLKTPYIDNGIINKTLGLKEISKEEPKEKIATHGGWHRPTLEEWNTIKDTIPDLITVKEEEKQPVGRLEASKRKRKKSGVISLEEVLKNAE